MSGEKTEEPTQQKLKKARQEGQIGRSQDIGAWVGMLAASIMLPRTLSKTMEHAQELMEQIPDQIADPDVGKALAIFREALLSAAWAVLPLALTMMAVGIVAAGAQGGIRVATKLFIPKFNRLNPFSGIKRMFGPQALWEGFKALFKTIVLGVVLYLTMQDIVPVLMTAGQLPLASLLAVRRRTQKQLRMSKEEVKQEHKNTEGDPLIKAQIRAKQHAMARNRQMADVPTADVVVVNPVHVAVALRYEPEKGAPRIVAKGKGPMAAKIRELATENRIPMVQDISLARALNQNCEVGQEIPAEFYGAVAKVLAFVMSLKARGAAAGFHRNPNPTPAMA
jgi:flagellar biosynthetic protein FlhB